jgi:hypothetical protein
MMPDPFKGLPGVKVPPNLVTLGSLPIGVKMRIQRNGIEEGSCGLPGRLKEMATEPCAHAFGEA